MSGAEHWIEKSPYTAALGARLESLAEGEATIALPYREENSTVNSWEHSLREMGSLAAILRRRLQSEKV